MHLLYFLIDHQKVVHECFISSFVEISKVLAAQHDGPLKFWIIGDGKLRKSVENDFASGSELPVKFWGNVPAEDMPGIMNCIDVLVLPSLNEGLPLVCAEALSCGANVVGSEVGGIPEIIGKTNTVLHPEAKDDTFVSAVASKVSTLLQTPEPQSLPAYISWKSTAQKEYDCLNSL